MMVRDPFRRVRETRRGPNGKALTRPSRIRPPPIRNDRGSRQQHGRRSNAPCLFWYRPCAPHLQDQAAVPAARPSVPRGARRRSRAARSSSRRDDPPVLARTSSWAISARIAVAEIGVSSVTERVTEWRSAKRTRTVTVLPGRHFARRRVATLSARWRSVGRKTRSSAGFLPSADWAPADRARRCVLMSRGSRFQARAVSLSPAARPSSRPSEPPGICASCPMVWTPTSANRALVTGPTPHINSTRRS